MNQLVSIVMPTYNQAHYLPEALDGVFAQTYPSCELIVVDDGSTDDTAQVLADYRRRFEFVVVSQENQRLPRALNAGFGRARGGYLTWTSSDNIMLPQMIEVLAQALDAEPEVGLVYADRYLMDDAGNDLGQFNVPDYDPFLILHTNLIHCCFLYRRECMERAGEYDPKLIYAEDWEYWTRIARHYPMRRIPQPLYRYRVHTRSMTSAGVRREATSISAVEFDALMRKRARVRWTVGKVKWWWLRAFRPAHPAIADRTAWQQVVRRAAGLDG